MLGKLIKHEFRATGRIMLPLFAIVLFISVLAHFSAKHFDSPTFDHFTALRVIGVIIIILFFIGIMAVSIVSVVLMINRFRKNILGDEGYLTMTLPASIHAILWAKIIVSLVWFALAAAVVILSLFILAFDVSYIDDMIVSMRDFIRRIDAEQAINLTTIGIELVLLTVLAGIVVCLTCYAALSFGHGFARHKMLYSVVFFFAATAVMSWLTAMLLDVLDIEALFRYNVYDSYINNSMRTWHIFVGIAGAVALVHGAVYYVITVLNLQKRLNLE